MGSFASNILPANPGQALGSSNQQWIAYLTDAFIDSVESNSLNPALSGIVRLASTDSIAWRNDANTADVLLSKSGAALNNVPADTLFFTGGGIEGPFISHGINPAATGEVRLAVGDTVSYRNNANTADITALSLNASDQVVISNVALSNVQSLTVAPTSPVFNNLQENEYDVGLVGSISPAGEFQAVQGSAKFTTEALTGAIGVPAGATVYQANAVAGYANTSSSTPNTVAGYFQGHGKVNGSKVWGGNLLAFDDNGLTSGVSLIGCEVDTQPQNPVGIYSNLIGVMSDLFAPNIGNFGTGFLATAGQTGLWNVAFGSSDGKASIFGQIGSATTAANSNSQPLNFQTRDSGNVVRTSALYADINGNFVLLPFGGNVLLSGAKIASYNGINTVGNGMAALYAATSLTAQTAALGTTTLYTTVGAGQYRLSWNAKITTAATTGAATSTLGPLTVVYTDPDGIAITLTAAATIAAGTVATSSGANTTSTVLLGVPLLLNCKAATVVSIAFAYASNTANQMAYNLNARLEAI